MTHNLILIGYRGTGKSTVARLLAERIGWRAQDADALLEARAGTTIRALFAAEGEPGFRDRESAVLKDLCAESGQVIATGGGVVLRPENRDLIRAAGWIAWLTAGVDTILNRLREDALTAERRPVLTTGGREEIVELLRIREPLYRDLAQTIVSTDDRSPEEVAAILQDFWETKGLHANP